MSAFNLKDLIMNFEQKYKTGNTPFLECFKFRFGMLDGWLSTFRVSMDSSDQIWWYCSWGLQFDDFNDSTELIAWMISHTVGKTSGLYANQFIWMLFIQLKWFHEKASCW